MKQIGLPIQAENAYRDADENALLHSFPLILNLARAAVRKMTTTLDSRDVAQEAVTTLLERERNRPRLMQVRDLRAYLAAVVRNTALRAALRTRRSGEPTPEGDWMETSRGDALGGNRVTPEEIAASLEEARQRVREIMSRLRPRDAAAFELIVQQGLNTREIAEQLATSENHVHQMRHRILTAAGVKR